MVIASWIHSYFYNVMTKFMVIDWTDAWKTDVNLLNDEYWNALMVFPIMLSAITDSLVNKWKNISTS